MLEVTGCLPLDAENFPCAVLIPPARTLAPLNVSLIWSQTRSDFWLCLPKAKVRDNARIHALCALHNFV